MGGDEEEDEAVEGGELAAVLEQVPDHSLSRFAPELAQNHYGEEMWAIYEKGDLRPDTVLTGKFVFDTRRADVAAVRMSIEDACQEAIIRQQGREEAAERD